MLARLCGQRDPRLGKSLTTPCHISDNTLVAGDLQTLSAALITPTYDRHEYQSLTSPYHRLILRRLETPH